MPFESGVHVKTNPRELQYVQNDSENWQQSVDKIYIFKKKL